MKLSCMVYPMVRRVPGFFVLLGFDLCRDDDNHEWADENGQERLAQCEWGWHPGRDWRVPHVPSVQQETCK